MFELFIGDTSYLLNLEQGQKYGSSSENQTH